MKSNLGSSLLFLTQTSKKIEISIGIFIAFFLQMIFFASFVKAADIKQKNCEEVFTYIYDHAEWGYNEDGLPGSGCGSYRVLVALY